jgi:hypothetical protein
MPKGHGDERRLTQVVLNLVGNAIKFSDTGAVIIKASSTNGSFTVAVQDNGPGISTADQGKIFEEFQQADNSATKKKGGTGLGLSISRRIVELHGGKLWVEVRARQGLGVLVHASGPGGGAGQAMKARGRKANRKNAKAPRRRTMAACASQRRAPGSEIVALRRELAEAQEQQAATSDVLRHLRSPASWNRSSTHAGERGAHLRGESRRFMRYDGERSRRICTTHRRDFRSLAAGAASSGKSVGAATRVPSRPRRPSTASDSHAADPLAEQVTTWRAPAVLLAFR